ncbi:SgcJ/EcaC family oxidoreductase [Nocardia asteroides]|uniref:SgcJ/EcaC family oxidoreductase n=1 Tax=Nocardia asteroides TaxID=1824 RepID=UPI00342997C9
MTTLARSASDERAVRALFAAQAAAWAAGDGAAFADTFTDDADFVSVFGEFVQGRPELAAAMQTGFDGMMRGTRLSEPDGTSLRFPTPDSAVLVTYGVRPLRPDAPRTEPLERSIQIRTAARTAAGWRFTSFQNTRIAAPAG